MAAHFEMTETFASWLVALKDSAGKARILARIRAAEFGNFGDCAPVGAGVSEMRIHVGPGYRLYFRRSGDVVYLLLVGGNKSTQRRDIAQAIEMSKNL